MTETTAAPPRPEVPRIEVEVPTLPRRALAAAIDLFPLAAIPILVERVLAGEGTDALPPSGFGLLDRFADAVNRSPDRVGTPLLLFLSGLVVWHLVFEVLLGGSPGKRLLGLRVVDRHGDRPGALRAAVHALLRPVSLATAGFGHLWAFADPERCTLYDRVAGLRVVRADPLGNRTRKR